MLTHDDARQVARAFYIACQQGRRAVALRANSELIAYLRTLPDALKAAAVRDLCAWACGERDEDE